MASLSLARPGNFSARKYVGDLAGLFERQRSRAGVALTPESFASDLADNDTLRSSLFTLCSAISRMGESDLSPEELLDLVARALCGAGSAEGETGTRIPEDMREAFLSGYLAWQNRNLRPTGPDDAWPPAASAPRKPPARESAAVAIAQSEAAVGTGTAAPVPANGRRMQEALGRVHREQPDLYDPRAALPRDAGEDARSMTLGELHQFLDEIESRVSRIGPHIQQLKSAAQVPGARERDPSALLHGGVIPFPDRRNNSADGIDDDPSSAGLHQDGFARRRTVTTAGSSLEAHSRSQAPGLRFDDLHTDDRPPGIDALLAAAPAWANATPTARSFSEEAFLSRHAYLSPARRPGTLAPASLYHGETPAQPLAPPTATLAAAPALAPLQTAQTFTTPPLLPAPPRFGLDADDDPLLSPWERLQASMQRLPPRKVFLYLASLTVLAGGLAGWMAYRTFHPHLRQFKDLQSAVPFDAAPIASPAPAASSVPAAAAAPIVPAPHAQPPNNPSAKPAALQGPVATLPRPELHASPVQQPPVAVWPPVPQQTARETAPAPSNSAPASTAPASPAQSTPSGPLYVPAPTMIGYALATPQPAYPAQANGASGTVTVEITISRLGDVTSARAVSGPAELRAAAVSAVRGWRFRPYLAAGAPVAVSTTLQFFFSGP